MDKFRHILEEDFIAHLTEFYDGKVYVVGGSCRDFFLGKEPKDIDLVVCGVQASDVLGVLNQYGHADLVGESFGVFKFKTFDGQEYDIALPRRDYKIEGEKGHKSIEVQSDHTLTIVEDLCRRDFTINAIAIGSDLQVIDPFNGMDDLNKGIIRAVSDETFVEDPLRMLRAIQFAARFDFEISLNTFDLIKGNKHLIKEITPERVLMEFQKVFEKNGNAHKFAYLLDVTAVFREYFGRDIKFQRLVTCEFLSEFLHFGIADTIINTADFYKKFLKIDNDLFNELKALNVIYNTELKEGITVYHVMFNAMRSSDIVMRSGYIGDTFKQPFLEEGFPKTRRELAISGDDLVALGLKEGRECGEAIQKCLDSIFTRKVRNDRQELLTILGL